MATQPRQTRENKLVNWSADLRPKVGDSVSHNSAQWVNVTGLNSEPSVGSDWERQFPQNGGSILVDSQLNQSSINPVENRVVTQEFQRTNLKPKVLDSNISNQIDLLALNYSFNSTSKTINIELYQNNINDFNFAGVCKTDGDITFSVPQTENLNIVAPNGLNAVQGDFYNVIYVKSTNTFIVYIFTNNQINNITDIPARSYNDLQDLPALSALAFLSQVDTAEIRNNAVTNLKLANMNAKTFKGRLTGSGQPQDIPLADLPISDDVANALSGKVDKKTDKAVASGTYTLLASDVDKHLMITAPCTVLVPNGLASGLEFQGEQVGGDDTDVITFVAESGGTLNVTAAFQNKTDNTFSVFGIRTHGSDVATLYGTLKLNV